jgi:hypothetical protein
MRRVRWMTGMGLGALCVAGAVVAPALQAQESDRNARLAVRQAAPRGAAGSFTPAGADPKLAAILARSGLGDGGFRFTPSESRKVAGRGVTVAVNARTVRAAPVATRTAATTPAVSLTPIAYNLGVSVGWKRFALTGDVTRVRLAAEPGSRERADLGLNYSGKRVGARLSAATERPLADTPVLIGDKPSYSIDLNGSYSLTRNLDVTAGVRYKSERDRLPDLDDDRRESRSVYVGTAFRF